MKKKLAIIIFVTIFILTGNIALAEEKIDDFSSTIEIKEDGMMLVTENILYDFGDAERHGIYRDIPYKYQARGGSFRLRIGDIAVTDAAGESYRFETGTEGDNFRIKIGDPDAYVSGKKEYIISYTVGRAINFFDTQDELYWNTAGNEWTVPIEQVKTTVILPVILPEKDVKAACYAGPYGSSDQCISTRYEYSGRDVKSIVFTDDFQAPGEGLSIVVGMPKGTVKKPSILENAKEFAKDNFIVLLPAAIFLLMYYLWRKKGKDPKGRGVVVAQYDAPQGLSPAEVGTIIDEHVDRRDISAEIICLAVNGYLKIRRIEGKGIFNTADYELTKLKDADEKLLPHQLKLFNAIFDKDGATKLSDLKDKFYKDWEEVQKGIYARMEKIGMFKKNPNRVRVFYMISGIMLLVLSFWFGPLFGPVGIVSIVVSAAIIVVFSRFMPVRTKAGAIIREEILGLKDYLGVAEADRLKFHNAPEKNPEHFERLLPYAMALRVEEEWAKQFEDIYRKNPSWYEDSRSTNFSALALMGSLNNFSTKASNTMTSHPSSAASGGSGFSGGFSGGGFGGGGGGSW